MTGAEFNAEVLNFLDTDARRRGIEGFRSAFIRAALSDLGAYVDEFNTGKLSYADDEVTPFDTPAAEAVAEFVKAKIARNVDRDLQLSQVHMADYAILRRRLFLRLREGRVPELTPFIGKQYSILLNLRTENRLPLPITANVWFTVKSARGVSDKYAVAALQRGDGIEIQDAAASQIRVTMTPEQTGKLSPDCDYYWDVQVESPTHAPVFPLRGVMRGRLPVTDDFAVTIMDSDGVEPLLSITDGIPTSFIP